MSAYDDATDHFTEEDWQAFEYDVLHPTQSLECVDCQGFGVIAGAVPCHRCDGTGIEPLSLERAILDENDRAEQRAIQEVENAAPLAVEPCQHHDFRVRAAYGSPFDDHDTAKGWCPTCQQWLVVLDYKDGRPSETRPMTADEVNVFARYEQRYAESEWIGDYQEGQR